METVSRAKNERLGVMAGISAVVSAFLASLCCVGPLVFAFLGIGGAGILVKFEPYRPLFSVITLGLLGAGFFFSYRKPVPTEDCEVCEVPRTKKLGRLMLWIATVLVVGFLAFPSLAAHLGE